jgi:hypothetical protein
MNIGHVDEDHWLKLDNGSLPWEVVFVALFHLGGQLMCPSHVLSPPKEKGYYRGALTRVTFHSPP